MVTTQLATANTVRRGIPAVMIALLLAAPTGASAAAIMAHPGPARVAGAGTAGVISTVAGGVGGPARATKVAIGAGAGSTSQTCGVAVSGGRLYVANGSTLRAVNARTDGLTTPGGTGAQGPLGDGGPATAAEFGGVCAVAVDQAGNLVVADGSLNRIRVIAARTATFYGQTMKAGDIYTVAGDGQYGFGGSGVPATQAPLSGPVGVTVDQGGNLVLTDAGSAQQGPTGAVVQVVAVKPGMFYGQHMIAGDIYTVAGNRADTGLSGDGGSATKAGLGELIGDVTVDHAGNLVVSDEGHDVGQGRERVVAVKNGTFYGQAMKAGDIYTVAGGGADAQSSGIPATGASLGHPSGVAVDAAGNLVVTDNDYGLLRVVAVKAGTFYGQAMKAGDIYTVAGGGTDQKGNGVPATSAGLGFNTEDGVTVDAAGNLVLTDSLWGLAQVVAASAGRFYGEAMKAGDIYTVAGNGLNSSGDKGPATRATFSDPASVAADGTGDLLVADDTTNVLRWVAASAGTFFGQPMKAGHIYTIAGDGTGGFAGDGGPATKAELSFPAGGAFDRAGNVLIADSDNNRIRVVAAATGTFYGRAMKTGDIYTVAGDGACTFSGDGGPATSAGLCGPAGVAVDASGNLVIAAEGNNRIRVVAAITGTFYGQAMKTGDIYTVAGDGADGFTGDGGPATSAELFGPTDVAVDGSGNLVIADEGNERIRVVAVSTGTFYRQAMKAGDIYTIAGGGLPCSTPGNGGRAVGAGLCRPAGVAVDAAGNVLIADQASSWGVRAVAAVAGTFYGLAMKAGDIYTIAGDGESGFFGDGGPGGSAEVNGPSGVAVTQAGGALIADSQNFRIRMVTGGPVPHTQP